MAEINKNNEVNVSGGKGVAGGYFYVAPVGSTLPTDCKSELDPAFKTLGFVSEDGVTFSSESDSEELKDMNGDTIDTLSSSQTETFTVTLAEVKKGTQAALYGAKNVTDEAGVLTVHVNGKSTDKMACVFELLLKNDRKWRRVVPIAKVTEVGDLTVAASELVGREATFTAFKDKNGDFYIDYIESTETEMA